MLTTCRDVEHLFELLLGGRPAHLPHIVTQRLGVDELLEKAYSLGVEHGRAQIKAEHAYYEETQDAP